MLAPSRRAAAGLVGLGVTVMLVSAPVLASSDAARHEPIRAVEARPASALVDSVGVAVHLGYLDTPYVETDRVVGALKDLGVRHVRDELLVDQPVQWAALRELADAGVRSDLIVGPRPDQAADFDDFDPREQVDVLTRELSGAVDTVEGLNEWDLWGGRPWAREVRSWQRGLYAAVRAEPELDDVEVLAPSITWGYHQDDAGSFARDADVDNAHFYPGGLEPGQVMREKLDGFRSHHVLDRPLFVTETGYHDATGPASQETIDHPPVPERVAATYLPRLLVGNLAEGVSRSYLYELLDEAADPRKVSREDNFGLLRHDFTPKPAFTAVRDLLRLASRGEDRVGAGRSGTLTFGLDDVPADGHRMLLWRGDGSFLLLLWRDVSTWDVRTRTPLEVDPADVTVELGSAARWSVHHPGHRGVQRGESDRIRVDLGARLAAVVIEPR